MIYRSPKRTTPSHRPRGSLHEDVVGRVREMILEGTLPPGQWIAEIKLCSDLRVSRTPLREALKVLASEGLVRLVQNRGAMVTEVGVEEIVELFEIMGPLEELIGALAAGRMSDAEIAGAEAMHRKMVDFHRTGRRREYFSMNQAIHLRFAQLSGNAILASTYANFAGRIRRARYLANLSDARWAESVREHAAFMAALKERDASAFADLLREHSQRTGQVVCIALRELSAAKAGKANRAIDRAPRRRPRDNQPPDRTWRTA
jgi:DNA-binding GntR family transcriptional regulator